MWVLPVWGALVFRLILAIGVAPRQPPPTSISGPIIAVLSSALLLVRAAVLRTPKWPIKEAIDRPRWPVRLLLRAGFVVSTPYCWRILM